MTTTLHTLTDYPMANYLTPGTVAHRDHMRAKAAGSGPQRTIRLLADAIHDLAQRVGPGSDDAYSLDIIEALTTALHDLLNLDRGGWDGGTVSAWAHSVHAYLGEDK